MKKEEALQAQALALKDRAMEQFKECEEDLLRVFRQGPRGHKDIQLARKCMGFTLGELYRHKAKFADLPDDE